MYAHNGMNPSFARAHASPFSQGASCLSSLVHFLRPSRAARHYFPFGIYLSVFFLSSIFQP